jgi:CheY-like chemotaxis protein
MRALAEQAAAAERQAAARQAAADEERRLVAERYVAELQAREREIEAAEREAAELAERRRAEEEAAAIARRRFAELATAEAARRAAEQKAAEAEAEAARAAAAKPAPRPRAPEETLVMVADDSKVVRVKTSRLLAQHGYRVVLAEDGAQAAQLIEAEVPAVLVTDVEMPGLDGLALTRHVRAHPRAGRIPIIMITSADDRLKAAAAEAGVTLVLGKPYPEADLIACIERSQAAATA